MQEYDNVAVDLPEKIEQLLDARGVDPATLVDLAVNRMMAQLPLMKERRAQDDRRTHLRLVTWESP